MHCRLVTHSGDAAGIAPIMLCGGNGISVNHYRRSEHMQVTSYQCRTRQPRRGPLAAGLLLCFASIVGVAQATEFITGFDEKLKAPMAMGATELKSRAQSYSAS